MESSSRNRIVTAISSKKLNELVHALKKEGWQTVGEIALAQPITDTHPPYFWQAMRMDKPKPHRTAR